MLAKAAVALLLGAAVGGCRDGQRLDYSEQIPADERPAAQRIFDYRQLRVGDDTAAERAQAFIDTLSAAQRAVVQHEFDPPERANWSNLPASVADFERNGVRLGDLNDMQTEAMHRFLAVSLSAHGYETVTGIVGAEDILAAKWWGAGRFQWDGGDYWLAFFGAPSNTQRWAWQFGGHHLAVNVTVADGRSYLSPTFVGTEPASYESDGGRIAPMAGQVAAGLSIVDALDEAGRVKGRLARRPRGTLTGAGKDGVVPWLDGVAVQSLNTLAQQRLMDAVRLWIGMLPADSAAARLAEVRTDWPQTYFAWYGSANGTGVTYYRIQGPALIIEFSSQGDLGADSGHYHSMVRDPTNDYGRHPRSPSAID